MIRNIIFDVGNVLVEWDSARVLKDLGFGEAVRERIAAASFCSKNWEEVDRGLLSDEELVALFASDAPGCEDEIRLFWKNAGSAIRQYDYTVSWLRDLKARGMNLYALSNYNKRIYEDTLPELSFLSEMDGSLFSFEIHEIKPEPPIYLALMEKYGLKPEECVFIDDRADNVETARQLGMEGIHFTGKPQADAALGALGVSPVAG